MSMTAVLHDAQDQRPRDAHEAGPWAAQRADHLRGFMFVQQKKTHMKRAYKENRTLNLIISGF